MKRSVFWFAVPVAAAGGGMEVFPQTFAYVANQVSRTVSVIHVDTNTVIRRDDPPIPIPVGRRPLGVAITPNGRRVYVTDSASRSVHVIDTNTDTVIERDDPPIPIPVGQNPGAVAIAPNGRHVYVGNHGANTPGARDTVSVIAAVTNSVVATIPVGDAPGGIAFTPDGRFAYVANHFSHDISIIDTRTYEVLCREDPPIPIPVVGPASIAITPDGTRAIVANGSCVHVIATQSNTVVEQVCIAGGGSNEGLAITPDGTRLYVATAFDERAGTVSVLDIAGNTLIPRFDPGLPIPIPVGSGPVEIAITPDGTRAYVTNLGFNEFSNTVSVIDTSANSVAATLTVGESPFGIAIGSITSRPQQFIRCDPNDDGASDIGDAVWILGDLFRDGPPTACPVSADCNADGVRDLTDAVYAVSYQLRGGSPPPPPFPDCGRVEGVSVADCPSGSTRCF
jgi:YVTN family beta-propeller protein